MRRGWRIALAIGAGTVGGAVILAVVLVLGFMIGISNLVDGPRPRCDGKLLKSPPPSSEYGTPEDVCTRGATGNPGSVYGRAYPSDTETQERLLGDPARFSGYTTWIDSVTLVPASVYVDGYTGDYVRIEVRVFNRDSATQLAGARDFSLWRRDVGFRRADFVGARDALPDRRSLVSGHSLVGAVYLYAGDAHGDLFVRYDPDRFDPMAGSSSTGVWQVTDNGRPLGPGGSIPPA